MNTITVWMVKSGEQSLIFFEGSLVEVFSYTREHPIPFSVEAAATLIFWRSQWIPVIRASKQTSAFVVLETTDPTCPFIALATSASPSRLQIDDAQFTESDGDGLGNWKDAAISAVTIDSEISPIIDPGRLVTADFIQNLAVSGYA